MPVATSLDHAELRRSDGTWCCHDNVAAYYEAGYHTDQILIYKLRQDTFSAQYADTYTTELANLCLVLTCFDQSSAGLPSMYGRGPLFEPGSHGENAEEQTIVWSKQ